MSMQNNYSQYEKRKQEHIELALQESNQAIELNVLDQVTLIHEALPDLDFAELAIHTTRFGEISEKPFLVSSMTAGHHAAIDINHNLMEACAASKWAMGVGSQRRELTDQNCAKEWEILCQKFPQVTLFSNLGIAQLIHTSLAQVQRLIDAIAAKALIIHCNPLQEVIQLEGTPQFNGCWQALTNLVNKAEIPIIVKETGCGFSQATLQRLNDIGVAAVDVSGLGGTHWGRIEGQRARVNSLQQKTAESFRNWGIDTVQSIQNAKFIRAKFEVWGSGGVRHGLDAAKLFALGVSSVGFAKPMLYAALQNAAMVFECMNTIEYELKVAMFCTGSRVLSDLKEKVCQ